MGVHAVSWPPCHLCMLETMNGNLFTPLCCKTVHGRLEANCGDTARLGWRATDRLWMVVILLSRKGGVLDSVEAYAALLFSC